MVKGWNGLFNRACVEWQYNSIMPVMAEGLPYSTRQSRIKDIKKTRRLRAGFNHLTKG